MHLCRHRAPIVRRSASGGLLLLLCAGLSLGGCVGTGALSSPEEDASGAIDGHLVDAGLDQPPADLPSSLGDATPSVDTAADTASPDATADTIALDTTADSLAPDTTVDSVAPDTTVDTLAPDATVDTVAPDTTVDLGPCGGCAPGATCDRDRCSYGGTYEWDFVFTPEGPSWAGDVEVDANGDVVVLGSFVNPWDFGGGLLTPPRQTGFLLKLTAAGDHVWSRILDGSLAILHEGLALDAAGNAYVFWHGPTVNTVQAFDKDGNPLWSYPVADPPGQPIMTPNGIAADAAGNVVMTGRFEGAVDFGGGSRTSAGGNDGFVFSLSSAGVYRWDKVFGNTSWDVAANVSMGPSGEVVFGAYFNGSVDFGGGPRDGSSDYLVSLASDGSHRWDLSLPPSAASEVLFNTIGPTGNVVVGSRLTVPHDFGGGLRDAGAYDLFVLSLSSAGAYQWDRTYIQPGTDTVSDIAVNERGDIFVHASFGQPIDLGDGSPVSGRVLFSLRDDGSFRWQRGMIPGTGTLTIEASGAHVILGGTFTAAVDFGGGVRIVGTANSQSGVVLKLND